MAKIWIVIKRVLKWSLVIVGTITVFFIVIGLVVENNSSPEVSAERERAKVEREAERAAKERAETEEKERATAQKLAEQQENKRKGFHCLSSWDGSHADFKKAIKNTMREPSSFEHVETKVTPVDENGSHKIIMQYRARNGFGGMNVGVAVGTFRNNDCSFSVISVE